MSKRVKHEEDEDGRRAALVTRVEKVRKDLEDAEQAVRDYDAGDPQ